MFSRMLESARYHAPPSEARLGGFPLVNIHSGRGRKPAVARRLDGGLGAWLTSARRRVLVPQARAAGARATAMSAAVSWSSQTTALRFFRVPLTKGRRA